MNQQLPAVSICVPVYNGEKYLAAFLESALSQTLKEIEIICVDNHSTDSSKDIICEFSKKYPGKVLYYQTDHHYPSAGAGRNVAVCHARGEYLYFCDSDDLITPAAMEKMYECAKQNDSELVCAWAYWVAEDEEGQIRFSKPMSYKKTQHVSNEIAIQSGCEFWMRLIKKELATSVGKIPQEYAFDDVAYVTVLNSYAKNIMFLDFPVYYYFRRENSTVGCPKLFVCETSILAEKYALKYCNPKYRKEVEKYVANRTKNNLEYRWQFFNLFAQWSKEQMSWLVDNELVIRNKALFDKLKWAAESVNTVPTPSRVIISGFGQTPTKERIAEVTEKLFCDSCELIILDETTCNIDENPYIKKAYAQDNYDLVSKYFALKEIYERGGIYVHENIRILNYFYYYTYQNAFFALLDRDSYSDMVFGAPPSNEVYADLLLTYSPQWDKRQIYPSLSQRIKTILTAKYGIPLDGKGRFFQPVVSVIPSELCVVDTRIGSESKRVVCEHDFSAFADRDDYITLKRSSLELLLSHSTADKTSGNLFSAERELAELKNSNAYKLVMLLKRISNGPLGPACKKIFFGCLKIKKAVWRMRRK